ncbi:MAG: type II toxin-antitoxin system RelE/ParE family toxin [Nitrospirae bacterium]|nr:type II toxin-antitoxin system RelE/ParE family toxin [Nitrospirota bacterium]
MKRRSIRWSRKAQCEFNKLEISIANRILERIVSLTHDLDNIKALKGKWANHYRCAVGQWRVIFELKDSDIIIKTVGHRSKIYKT